jgi:hypothetical protein
MKKTLIAFTLVVSALVACGEEAPANAISLAGPNSNFLVKLTSGVSAKTSKVGDKITAVVIVPRDLRGGRVSGTVQRADHAIVRFAFDTVEFRGKTLRLDSELTSVVSSKGNAGQDDLQQRVRIDGGNVIAYGVTTAIDEGAEIRFTAWAPASP